MARNKKRDYIFIVRKVAVNTLVSASILVPLFTSLYWIKKEATDGRRVAYAKAIQPNPIQPRLLRNQLSRLHSMMAGSRFILLDFQS